MIIGHNLPQFSYSTSQTINLNIKSGVPQGPIQARNQEYFGVEEVFRNKDTLKTFHVRHIKEELRREKKLVFFL